MEGFDNYLNELKVKKIEALGHHPNHEELEKILSWRIRSEKVAIKDIKLRTFIAEGNSRNDLAAHVYVLCGVVSNIRLLDFFIRASHHPQQVGSRCSFII